MLCINTITEIIKVQMSELNYILKGYKKTLLGIVPQNWEVKSIEDIFITFPNASYSRQQICENGDVKYIHYGDIHTKYTYVLDLIDDSIPTITEEQASRYTYLRNGDLIMTDASEDYTGVGKCIEIVNTNDTKAVSGLHTISLRDTNSIYVDGFRKYLTQITNVKLQLEKRAVGTKVYSISYNSIKSCLVPVPPINEQKKIVAILDIWDKAIELQTKLIEKLELRKRAMMQRLLTGRVRLNGFSGQWRKVKLGELCEITTGSLNADAMKEDGIYPFFTCAKEVYKIDKYAFNTEALLISGNGEHLGYIHYYKGRFNAYQRTYILDKFIIFCYDFAHLVFYCRKIVCRKFMRHIEVVVKACAYCWPNCKFNIWE